MPITNSPKNVRSLGLYVGVFFIIIAICGAYLAFIGIPRTQARNLYNQAELAIEAGEKQIATDFLKQAYHTWPEEYIKVELNQLSVE